MKKLLFWLFFLFSSVHAAQSLEKSIATQAHIASVNALLVFTSHEGVNSGLYSFDKVGVDMQVYHLPLTYHFHSSTDINFFVVGNVGYSKVYISKEIIIPPSSRLDYENHLRTYMAGIGGGFRYRLAPKWSSSTGFELLYTRSGISIKQPDDDIGDAIEDFFNKNYNDNISYKFFTNIEYKTKIKEFDSYLFAGYKFYDTKSSFTFNELLKIRSHSNVVTLAAGSESPKLYEKGSNYLTCEGYAKLNYLEGVVADVVKFNTFYTLGGVLYYYTPLKPWWASRFFVELSNVQASGMSGYNLGVGFTLEY